MITKETAHNIHTLLLYIWAKPGELRPHEHEAYLALSRLALVSHVRLFGDNERTVAKVSQDVEERWPIINQRADPGDRESNSDTWVNTERFQDVYKWTCGVCAGKTQTMGNTHAHPNRPGPCSRGCKIGDKPKT